MSQSKNQFDQVMKSLENLDAKMDKVRTEDIPGIHTRLGVLETVVATLKEDVRKEAKRDAKIYGGIGSAVASLIAIALGMKH